jgi:hypothetical protein
VISCKEAAELASQSQDRSLNLTERFALRFHTFRCKLCARYAQQLRFLRDACERIDDDGAQACPQLPDDARERIQQRLKQS